MAELTRARAKMEARRMDAAKLFKAGASVLEVARQMRVSRTSAYRWLAIIESGGKKGLAGRKPPGRGALIDFAALGDDIRDLYDAAIGYERTGRGFAVVLEREYGVLYHHDHVTRVLRRLGCAKDAEAGR